MKTKFCFLLAGMAILLNAEASKVDWFKLDANGQFQIGNITSGMILQKKNYTGTAYENAVNCRFKEHLSTIELDTTIFRDEFLPFKGWKPVLVEKRLTVHGKNNANWRYTITMTEDRELARLALCFNLPESDFKSKTNLRIDGKILPVPEKFKKVHLFQGKVREIQISSSSGDLFISGNLNLIVSDPRIWNNKTFTLILLFNPHAKVFRKSSLEFDLRYQRKRLSAEDMKKGKFVYFPVSLKKYANNSVVDRIADDGSIGWTDQGAGNDLRCFKESGLVKFCGIPFEIAPFPGNIVTVAGRNWKQYPESAVLFKGSRKAGGIYFLHTAAWPAAETGNYKIQYEDQTSVTIPVRYLKEVFNWTESGIAEQTITGWTGRNSAHKVYLNIFAWPNPHPEKTITEITMSSSANRQVFFSILGLTFSEKYPYLPDDTPDTVKAVDDSNWNELSEINEDQAAKSAIDVSRFIPAPAGKFGFVTAKGESFFFENGKKAHFLGVNFDHSDCFPQKENIIFHAKKLRRLGFNIARFHKYDLNRGNSRSLWKNNKNTAELDSESLDRMFYAISELKKNGIYTCLDLLTCRSIRKSEYPEFSGESFYTYSIFMPRLIELQKIFIKKLLTTTNPYTGLPLAKDPALALLILQNEDSLLYQPNRNSIKDPIALLELKKQFNTFLLKKYRDRKTLAKSWKTLAVFEDHAKGSVELPMNPAGKKYSEKRLADIRLFFYELQCRYYCTMYNYIRSLGVRVPITGSNHWTNDPLDLRANAETDFVDRHAYWSHPSVIDGWAFHQILFNPEAMVRSESGGMIGNLAARRVAGKPFAVTEWNNGSTNEFRADAQLLLPAYAAMHDWHIFQFSYSTGGHGGKYRGPMIYSFGISGDPVQLSMMPASAILFHRRDPYPGAGYFYKKISNKDLENPGYNPETETIEKKALRGKAGIAFEEIKPQPGKTGTPALDWDPRTGKCKIDSVRSQGFTGFPNSRPILCKDAVFLLKNDFASILLTSLDDKPLSESKHMLFTAIARGWNKGMKFNALRNRITKLGTLPRVMEPVKGSISLNTKMKKAVVYELNYSGSRMRKLAIRMEHGKLCFDLSGAPHYELLLKP